MASISIQLLEGTTFSILCTSLQFYLSFRQVTLVNVVNLDLSVDVPTKDVPIVVAKPGAKRLRVCGSEKGHHFDFNVVWGIV